MSTTDTAQPPTAPQTPAAVQPAPQPALSEHDLNALRDRIRSEERSRNQTRLAEVDALEQKAAGLQTRITELESLLNTATSELKLLKQSANSAGQVDITRVIAEATTSARHEVETAMRQQVTDLSSRLSMLEDENRMLKTSSLRDRRIREETAKGRKFIAELVAGSDEASIEASLISAEEAYRKYVAPAQPTPPAAPVQPAAPAAPVAGVQPVTPVAHGPSPVRDTTGAPRASDVPGAEGAPVEQIVQALRNNPKLARKVYGENRDVLLAAAAEDFRKTGAGQGNLT